MGLIMKNGIQYPGNASSGGEDSYTLPIASTETLGGIKVGENLSITEDGTLNAEASGTSVLSPGAVLYDTKEKVIGKWINGKPIYQKTVTTTERVICNYIDYINVPCSNLPVNIDNLLCCKISQDFYSFYMTVAKIDSDNVLKIWSSAPQGSLGLNAGTYITLQYTKTTDEPNSFRPEMIENISIMRNLDFSNIYSLDEKIIGCWVNGKPIYQKVIYVNIVDKDWHNIQLDVSVDFVVKLKGMLYYGDGYPYFIEVQGNTYPDTNERSMLLYKKDENYIRYGVLYTQTDFFRIWNMRNTTLNITHVVIQYTKTTDEENSFTPDMIIDHENITDAEIAEAAAADKI